MKKMNKMDERIINLVATFLVVGVFLIIIIIARWLLEFIPGAGLIFVGFVIYIAVQIGGAINEETSYPQRKWK